MVGARFHIIFAALLVLTACDASAGQSSEAMETVRFAPGMHLRQMVSERLYKQLSPQIRTDGGPFVVTIGTPHVLKLELGSEEIEIHPGGYNSTTYMISGYSRGGLGDGTNRDYSRIGTIDSDTGSERLTLRAARDLAIRFDSAAGKYRYGSPYRNSGGDVLMTTTGTRSATDMTRLLNGE